MTLVSHWPLTEDSGSKARDYESTNDGTANGAGPSGTGTVDGPLGQSAYDFDGSDDSVNLGSNTFSYTQYTLSCWVNFDTLPSSGNVATLISIEGVNQLRYDDTEGQFEFVHYDDAAGTTLTISAITPSTATWYHVLGSFDGDAIRLYVNSVEEAVNTGNSDSNMTTFNRRNSLGANKDGTKDYLDGALADVRVYDRALSPSEIQYLYNVSQSARLTSETKTL